MSRYCCSSWLPMFQVGGVKLGKVASRTLPEFGCCLNAGYIFCSNTSSPTASSRQTSRNRLRSDNDHSELARIFRDALGSELGFGMSDRAPLSAEEHYLDSLKAGSKQLGTVGEVAWVDELVLQATPHSLDEHVVRTGLPFLDGLLSLRTPSKS
jgi:hypothetical protein